MIRPAVMADVKALLEIEARCFTADCLSRRSFRYMLRNDKARLFVAENDGVLAGYVLTLMPSRGRLARHYSLAVLPDYRGQGIAEALLREAERTCAKDKQGFKLEVRKGGRARRLYERLGYRVTRVREGYYEDGSDAYEMVKLI